jgi:hypothetical protein
LSCLLGTDPNTPFVGGDSGGGVFDREARLVAIHRGIGYRSIDGSIAHTNPRIELFREHNNELHARFNLNDDSPLASLEAQLQLAGQKGKTSIVEVLDGKTLIALGTIVAADGRILTKASALPETPMCRLAGGRTLPATIVKTLGEHDLAVLQVEANGLSSIEWALAGDPPVGTPVCVVALNSRPTNGVVSLPTMPVPPERGHVRAELGDGDAGLEVIAKAQFPLPTKKWAANFGLEHLEKGDVVVAINGHATPTLASCAQLLDPKTGDPIALSGDVVRISIRRQNQPIEFRELLGPPTQPRPAGQSSRCSGFAKVYNVSAVADADLCGGPVLDRDGCALGVVIASRQKGWLFVLPAAIAQQAADN